jgi:hypothetical protein
MARPKRNRFPTAEEFIEKTAGTGAAAAVLTAAPPALTDPPEPEEPKPVEAQTKMLGGREFVISPICERDDVDQAFEDQSEFAILAIPVIQRIFGLAMTAATETGLEEANDPTAFAREMVLSLHEQNIEDLLRDFKDRLPELATIACRGSEPNITVSDVKRLSLKGGGLLNKELSEIVWTQIGAENLIAQALALLSDFSGVGK